MHKGCFQSIGLRQNYTRSSLLTVSLVLDVENIPGGTSLGVGSDDDLSTRLSELKLGVGIEVSGHGVFVASVVLEEVTKNTAQMQLPCKGGDDLRVLVSALDFVHLFALCLVLLSQLRILYGCKC